MLLTYCNIGKRIVEQELGGSERAEYGSGLISALAEDLTKEFGKNYSKRNLHYYIKFYQCFPDEQIVNACVHNRTQYYYRLLQASKKEAVIEEMKQKTAEFQKNQFELIKSPVIAEFLGFKCLNRFEDGQNYPSGCGTD